MTQRGRPASCLPPRLPPLTAARPGGASGPARPPPGARPALAPPAGRPAPRSQRGRCCEGLWPGKLRHGSPRPAARQALGLACRSGYERVPGRARPSSPEKRRTCSGRRPARFPAARGAVLLLPGAVLFIAARRVGVRFWPSRVSRRKVSQARSANVKARSDGGREPGRAGGMRLTCRECSQGSLCRLKAAGSLCGRVVRTCPSSFWALPSRGRGHSSLALYVRDREASVSGMFTGFPFSWW